MTITTTTRKQTSAVVVFSVEAAHDQFGEDFDTCWNPVEERYEYAATIHLPVASIE